MNINLPNWTYIIILVALLIGAGAGEYLHLLPIGSFSSIFFLVLGLIAPSPAFPHTTVQTPQATINTNETVTDILADVGKKETK
jgi:hypothetical protein